ncbi:flagellar basal body L-ring protein FlgH [Porticoccus sp.]
MSRISVVVLAWFTALLVGCGGMPRDSHPDYAPVELTALPEESMPEANGSIFSSTQNLSLFEDIRARQVGDIVTVILAESTDAAKTSDTSLDKSGSTSIAEPIIGNHSNFNLGVDLSSQSGFEGESSSNQSNSLTGSIAVSVAKVMPNGNLYVQGEKWIQINQGHEFIRLRGIIRPVDISSTNTVLSTKVADARISYGGTGAPAEVNVVGWLSRFFMSPLWPF